MRKSKEIMIGIFALVLISSGCSASRPTEEVSPEGDFPQEEAVVTPEAQTDPVPPAEAEAAVSPENTSPGVEAPVAEPAPAVVAAEPVVPSAVPTTPEPITSAASSSKDYVVQEGDTLMKIAFEIYGDLYQWKKIYEDNKGQLSSPSRISKGTVLRVEAPSFPVAIERNGEKYLIKRGDTLGTISEDVYGTQSKWKKLWENNRQLIRDPNLIFAGFYLYYTMGAEDREEIERTKQRTPLAKDEPAAPESEAQATAVTPAPAQSPSAEAVVSSPGGAFDRAPASAADGS